jgi:hypothetical protein
MMLWMLLMQFLIWVMNMFLLTALMPMTMEVKTKAIVQVRYRLDRLPSQGFLRVLGKLDHSALYASFHTFQELGQAARVQLTT